MPEHVVIDDVSPLVSGGAHPSKAVVGEHVPVRATIWREGHEALAAQVVCTGPEGRARTVRMRLVEEGLDRWEAVVVPDAVGMWTFRVEAWCDPWATWRTAVRAKLAAGVPDAALDNDLESGARLLERHAESAAAPDRELLLGAAAVLRDTSLPAAERAAPALGDATGDAVARRPLREFPARGAEHRMWVDRPRALFGSWYEFFPRSTGGRDRSGRPVHGTFATAREELRRIADMGFDVVYLPPIHPIGEVNRKGRNNTLTARPTDVGSPWAVGSRHGGHDAVHPDLGTVEDFDAFVARARELGLEVALDLALQCAPDHPWVEEHPEWFTTRPDGTIAYAENPPKTYEDIYPLNFDKDPEGIFAEVLRIVRYWMSHGVRVFRVDNPHTKPPGLWRRLIGEIRRTDPDVVFLSEAFTRPAVLQGLAKLGFSQSYTYFTWRTTKRELTDYLEELVACADFLRPNFFVNTPDILPGHLRDGGPADFAVRAALAATLSPSWGVYSGFELYENRALRPDGEEYLDSEKYELRPRDHAGARAAGRSLEPWIATLNRLRREHPALQQLRTLRFHEVDDDRLIAYSKSDPAGGDRVLCVVLLDPSAPRRAELRLDESVLGAERVKARDEIDGGLVELSPAGTVEVDPARSVARVLSWRVR
ncbi:alpha-1,4-glucan--maltose-1-phosphate maltosyltransferase [Thermobifida cellulosilytica]|uniref:Alpha-1,4-glucan:maltose-1-phosphate maltosyltransferase n=1 Tax=Thermobifida cellulosilytica TB100 TaxID=665004 RepID=A0A147KMW6_THECS|nr:alpha-1,4-glucan--maltose-1-phosphate maltosyltransferase [Thermobifida cellulosilytica]KUP98597.1 alpha-1,4-glucan:maltose-1-phosphate maltosyltransferase [Thermobifida cellulosilytica TB100]